MEPDATVLEEAKARCDDTHRTLLATQTVKDQALAAYLDAYDARTAALNAGAVDLFAETGTAWLAASDAYRDAYAQYRQAVHDDDDAWRLYAYAQYRQAVHDDDDAWRLYLQAIQTARETAAP